MAFKKTPPTTTTPDSPDKLFNDLPRRKYSGLLDHQGQMLRAYARDGVNLADVALQLPTGSGKTLVGLLIAEWRRRKFRERVVYLCPTRQLVNQVVEEARTKYGLDVDGFTGRIREYDPAARTRYTNADRVAVTTYNSLFNTNPYFVNAHVVIVDDAHAAENYIAQLWTFRVERFKDEHKALFTALSGVLKQVLEPYLYARLTGDWQSLTDKFWVDKIPTPDLLDIADNVREVIDEYVKGLDLAHPWRMICEHLEACQFYVSSSEMLIRPLIPPTWAHAPFENAKQRIFMSATLGAGGDLERLTGHRKIKRLATPDGWDRQGIGRRFFIFPGVSLGEEEALILRRRLMKEAGRSLVLVPSTEMRDAVKKDVEEELCFTTFSADDIEETKKPFVESPEAVAIVANRYDGIDFPGDDCRLLFIEGLPRATNLQERFLMGRMGANLLFKSRPAFYRR
jgi:Rad3-related DNA helicase